MTVPDEGPGAQNETKMVPKYVVKGGPDRSATSFEHQLGDIELDCIFTIPNTFPALAHP